MNSLFYEKNWKETYLYLPQIKNKKKEEVEKIVTKSGGNDISFIENFISNYQIIKKFH